MTWRAAVFETTRRNTVRVRPRALKKKSGSYDYKEWWAARRVFAGETRRLPALHA